MTEDSAKWINKFPCFCQPKLLTRTSGLRYTGLAIIKQWNNILFYSACLHTYAHNSDFLICHMLLHMDFTLVCLCMDNFLPQLVCLRRTILPETFYNHCLPFECTYHALTICHIFDIWEVRIMSYRQFKVVGFYLS